VLGELLLLKSFLILLFLTTIARIVNNTTVASINSAHLYAITGFRLDIVSAFAALKGLGGFVGVTAPSEFAFRLTRFSAD